MIKHWQSNADMPADLRVETKARAIYAGQSLEDKLKQNERKRAVSIITEQDWQLLFEQIEGAGRQGIITKAGAVLYIEKTRAAIMIDIDSAASKLAPGLLSATILPDLFAAIRLRRLAGKILVDMPVLTKLQRADILKQADKLARCDLRFPDCLGFTRSGMMELSVRHGRPVLDNDDRVQAVIKSKFG
jgi:Ribonuclease G/E